MKIKIASDKQKAKALCQIATITLKRLNEIKKEDYPSNTLTDYYDIIHKCLEALTFIEGVKIKGEGAHKELIDYVSAKYELGESIRIFIQELRDYRNRISYEGFIVNPNYIKNNSKKIETIIEKLTKLISAK